MEDEIRLIEYKCPICLETECELTEEDFKHLNIYFSEKILKKNFIYDLKCKHNIHWICLLKYIDNKLKLNRDIYKECLINDQKEQIDNFEIELFCPYCRCNLKEENKKIEILIDLCKSQYINELSNSLTHYKLKKNKNKKKGLYEAICCCIFTCFCCLGIMTSV